MAWEQTDWYDTPRYYDLIFDADTAKEADFLEGIWERHGRAGGTHRLLEPACGSGRLIAAMAQRGWLAAGFDASATMLQHAQARCAQLDPTPLLWQDTLQHFTVLAGVGPFDLAHCLVSTFKYLLTEADARACLGGIAAALRPGGLLVLGMHLTDYARRTYEHERWEVHDGALTVVCNTRTWAPDRVTRLEPVRNRLRIVEAGREHAQETRWQFRTYSAAELHHTLAAAVPGLELVACHDFHYRLDHERLLDDAYSDVVVVLRKARRPGIRGR